MFEDKRYQYDTFGNLTEKKVGKHTQMHFSYDAEHQMTEAVVTKNNITQRYQYAYDPFGRRISKTDAFNRTDFVWDGNRLLSEARGSRSKTYVYEQDGFVPVAQVITHQGSEGTENDNTPTTKAANDLLYYHTDHLGTPRELSDQDGHIVWAASYKAWGNTLQIDYPDLQQKAERQAYPLPQEDIDRLDITQLREKRADKAHALIEQWEDDYSQNLRFQGQYFDRETGLHYNRFRYYDPDVGRFVTQDPIGLLGGDNLYQYAANPLKLVDPLGLAAENYNFDTKIEAFNAACSRAGICPSVKPDMVWTVGDDYMQAYKDDYILSKSNTTHGVYQQYETPEGSRLIVNHTNDGKEHFHAAQPKGDPCRSCVNFGWGGIGNDDGSERYGAIGGSHHFYYDD